MKIEREFTPINIKLESMKEFLSMIDIAKSFANLTGAGVDKNTLEIARNIESYMKELIIL